MIAHNYWKHKCFAGVLRRISFSLPSLFVFFYRVFNEQDNHVLYGLVEKAKFTNEKRFFTNLGTKQQTHFMPSEIVQPRAAKKPIATFSVPKGYKDNSKRSEDCGIAVKDAKYYQALAEIDSGHYVTAYFLLQGIDYKERNKLQAAVCTDEKVWNMCAHCRDYFVLVESVMNTRTKHTKSEPVLPCGRRARILCFLWV